MRFFLFLIPLLVGCGDGKRHSAFKGQIESQFVKCNLTQTERASNLESRYAKNFEIQDEKHREFLFRYLTLIPDEYLHWLFDDVDLRVELRGEGERVTGLRGLLVVNSQTYFS